jgi:ABC-type Zn uptake system ZnuABC Zn-binding protein ZnuA
MRRDGVRAILAEPYMDLKVAERVAQDTGARVVMVPTYAGGEPGDYAAMVRDLARAVGDARGH